MELVREAALKAQRGKNWGVFQWTVTEGLLRVDVDLGGAQKTLAQPEQLLKHIRATTMAGIYVLLDFHPYLDNPMFVRTLKDIAQDYDEMRAHARADQPRSEAAAGARASRGALLAAHAGQDRTAGHRHEDGARMGADERAACRGST